MNDPLPYRHSGAQCNAVLKGEFGDSYCKNISGADTSHPREGRCRVHDTEHLAGTPEDMMREIRDETLRKLMDPTITPSELNNLTLSLSRIEGIIDKHPKEDRPARVAENSAAEEELARVRDLRDKHA